VIKVGDKTIKTRDEKNLGIGSKFGYSFDEKIKVHIALGKKVDEPIRDYQYYEIECIKERY